MTPVNRRPSARIRRWLRAHGRRAAAALAVLIAAACVGVYAWLFADLPSIDALPAGLARPSTRILDREGRLLYEVIPQAADGGRHSNVALARIPQACQDATIATEDAGFYQHPGVDPVGVVRALVINLRGGDVLAGGSTITQQVARGLLFAPEQRQERTLRRKLREMILAVQLSLAYSKSDVLALYLNQSYYGHLAYGIDAAARAYFGKPVSALSLAECALLAGLPQAPAVYDPLTSPDAAAARQGVVLARMVAEGHITQREADAAQAERLAFAAAPFAIEAPHFVMGVIEQLEREYGDAFARRGLIVTTTLDLDWQHTAERIVADQLAALNDPARRTPADARNAALVALDPATGAVRALIGSPDYFDARIDGAVNAAIALRQPGSTLKPFTYAVALDPAQAAPWTAATVLYDVSTPFVTRDLQSYAPTNFAQVEHGPVSVREALASSLNIPAVIALEHVGIQPMVELAAEAGLSTLAENTRIDLAVTLGGGEVRLLDLTAAYGMFATGGLRVAPHRIVTVDTADGERLFTAAPAPQARVLDARVAWLTTDMLSDDRARILGFGQGSALNIGRPAAAKTGTTTDARDNWIVGYTPDLVVGVWVGNADNRPMNEVTGISGAAPIWNGFMRAALAHTPERPFPQPPGLMRAPVCTLSGLRPTPECPQRRDEWFIAGTEPTEDDRIWQRLALDRETGLLASPETPPERRVWRTFAVLPAEVRGWALNHGLPVPPPGAPVGQPLARPDEPAAPVRLLAPDPYTRFMITPRLPREGQRVRLHAAVPATTVSVTYLLDGQPLPQIETATASGTFPLWWPLEVGEHVVVARAVLADGAVLESAPIPFTVFDEPVFGRPAAAAAPEPPAPG
jgi:penicillin-binding protein 1C